MNSFTKKFLMGTLLVCGWSVLLLGVAQAGDPQIDIVEVPVTQVFVPAQGFDDNDTIEVVLDGYLPNSCYTLGDHWVERDSSGKILRAHQFAIRRRDGVCMEGVTLPVHLSQVVPYTTVLSVGRLKAGDYRVSARDTGSRVFNVNHSVAPSQDDFPYASVSGAYIQDVVAQNQALNVTLTGVLTSSCLDLDAGGVDLVKQGDVLVVLPKLTLKEGVCTYQLRPFEYTLNLGSLSAGRYLLHVRSANGKSVNHAFTVVPASR